MAVSFATDILPMFRPVDIQHMKPMGVLLAEYSYMGDPSSNYQNANNVYDYLKPDGSEPRMPLGGPYWNADQLGTYTAWMDGGYQP
jgi:hypothetical protein